MKPSLIFVSFVQSLETEKSQLASEKQVLMEEQEEMQKNLKSSERLGSKKLDELEGTLSNMSSALLARNEEISTLRQEIESKNLDLLNRESCISTLTDSKTQNEESFISYSMLRNFRRTWKLLSNLEYFGCCVFKKFL